MTATLMTLMLVMLVGCGVMGPPVPPQTVGVGAKRQQEERARERQAREQAHPESEESRQATTPVLTVPATQPTTLDEAEAGQTAVEQLTAPGLQPQGDARVKIR